MQKTILRYLLIINLVIFTTLSVSAQENQAIAVGTERGVWVYLGNEIPKEFKYQVFRKEGNGNFNAIGTTSFTDDGGAVNKAITLYQGYFEKLDKVTDVELLKLLDYASSNDNTDSIYIPNFPVMHLLLGTAFFDPEAKQGNSYQYRVVKLNDKKGKDLEKTSNVLTYRIGTDLQKPIFKDKQESGSQILLRWYVNEQRSLNSYNVHRRVFSQGEFMKIDAIKGYNSIRDSIYLIAIDTTVQNPAYYEYVIEPLDIYGIPGPKSDPVSAGTMGSSYNPVPEYFYAKGKDQGHEVELIWKFQEKSYLRSIEVFRSTSFDDGYIKVGQLSPKDTSFIDVVPVANENFWYYLQINGPTDQSMPTAKVAAMYRAIGDKPIPPEEVGAETIKGGVKVYWMYDEPHTKGFYVFRYVYEKAEYIQVSGLIPTGAEVYSFVDSSAYLQGNEVYRYSVCAVDDVDQMSDYSPSASASPGIKAVMQTPLNLRIRVNEGGLLVIWDDLRAVEQVLLGYKVYRKKNDEKEFKIMLNDTLRSDKNYYQDNDLSSGVSYTYAISALDYYGNESQKSLSVTYVPEQIFISPPEISRVVNTVDGIMISWGQVAGNLKAIKIYRSQPDGKAMVIATVPIDTDEYLDKSISKDQLYIYEISSVSVDDEESNKSKGMSVRR